MGEANGVNGAVPVGSGVGRAADREALLRTAAWAFADDRPPLPTAEQVARFEAEVLGQVRAWCAARADKVRACYVAAVRRRVGIFMVTHTPRFDSPFEGELAAFERGLLLAGWRVRSTPVGSDDPETLSDYFRLNEGLEVYANRRPAPAESRAEPPVPLHS